MQLLQTTNGSQLLYILGACVSVVIIHLIYTSSQHAADYVLLHSSASRPVITPIKHVTGYTIYGCVHALSMTYLHV